MIETEVVVMGGGIIGAFIFDTLTTNGIKTILIEKGEDVSLGATKANSGIIHAGYDCECKTLKAKYNVIGNKMYNKIAKRLGEKICNCGSLVVAKENELGVLKELLKRGRTNKVPKLKILKEKKLKKLEKNLSDEIKYGLYAKTAKIISPYHFCISLCEEAILNGGNLLLNCEIKKIEQIDKHFILSSNDKKIKTKYLINACANSVNEINSLLNEHLLDISFTKGEYILLDHSEQGLVSRPIFPLPSEKGKGILACPTVNGNIFFGPTAINVDNYDTSVNYSSINIIKTQVSNMIKNINFKKTIKLYAGVRVKQGSDFYIKFSDQNPNYLVISGICSPGLTSAPAIAKDVLSMLEQRGLKKHKIKLKKRKPYTNTITMSPSKLNKLIKKDKNYGEIVCRCENITKGEILEVLNGPIKPLTTDGIKRRLRTTMGRCQGSFCYPKLLEIMANCYKTDMSNIISRGKESLVVGNIKKGGIYEQD